ncbi:related to short-chain dehydrogenase/reductase family protein, putative [Cephalotrichum gorgonifer]|uniref:Related to short-chain dehydrogenase/reductase family protein, putative n=1 Tax=Cephalotrichum gorgonifer TaxID=2041049 RepID=A0AAE8SV50_9PEZI|nr:related to short-chain dehydrogenase/reductase family protein, putative [Cephalotrichum gorgonifer]
MRSHSKSTDNHSAAPQLVHSKDMPPIQSFPPVFINNQFRTKIALPTREMYPNAKGKCAIVTGSNTGLGLESARHLLSIGVSHLVMGVRSLEKGKAAAADLRSANPSATIEVWHLDMESYDSIQTFVGKCQESLPRIHIVILNAGLMQTSFETVAATGHERTVQVNHISTVFLAILLLPVLKAKSHAGQDPPCLTFSASVTAHLCGFPNRGERPLLRSFDDTSITPWGADDRYGVSKLLCQLFVVKLAEQISPDDVIINMVDPGLTKGTGLVRDAKGAVGLAAKMFFSAAGRPVNRGAATYVDAVLGHGKETHGCFLMNCKVGPLACWYYTDGEVLTDLIWSETLKELSFAGVENMITLMRPRS